MVFVLVLVLIILLLSWASSIGTSPCLYRRCRVARKNIDKSKYFDTAQALSFQQITGVFIPFYSEETSYCVTFEFHQKQYEEFKVRRRDYESLEIGYIGILVSQNNKFRGFEVERFGK